MMKKFLSEAWYQAERENAALRSKCQQAFWDSLGITPARDLTDIAPLSDPVGNMRALIEKTAAGREQDSSVRECLAMAQGPLSLFTSPLLTGRATTPTPSLKELQPYCFRNFFINANQTTAWLTQENPQQINPWVMPGGPTPQSDTSQDTAPERTTTESPSSDGMGIDMPEGTHLSNACSYDGYIREKFYEYAALAQMVYELATDAKLREQLMQSLGNSAVGNIIDGMGYSFIAQSYTQQISSNTILAWIGVKGAKERNEENLRQAEEFYELSRKKFAMAADQIGAAFSELWDKAKERFTTCGWLYGVVTLTTDGAFIAGETLLGAGIGKAAKEILKSIKLLVRTTEAGKYTVEVALTHGTGKTVLEQTFTKETLEKSFGTPQDNHPGVRTEAPNRAPTPEGNPDTPKKPDKPDEPSKETPVSKKVGDLAEKQAKQDLRNQGFTETYVITNNSGHGVDIIGVNPTTRHVKVLEVKANTATLSDAQKTMGGKRYTDLRLSRAANEEGWYAIVEEADGTVKKGPAKKKAENLLSMIQDNDSVEYQVWRYDVDPDKGTTTFSGYVNWDWEDGNPPSKLIFLNNNDKPFRRKTSAKVPPSRGPPLPSDGGPVP